MHSQPRSTMQPVLLKQLAPPSPATATSCLTQIAISAITAMSENTGSLSSRLSHALIALHPSFFLTSGFTEACLAEVSRSITNKECTHRFGLAS